VTIESIQNIFVSVERQGWKLAEATFKPTLLLPGLPHRPGILTKPETPFAPLFWDRYEAVKVR